MHNKSIESINLANFFGVTPAKHTYNKLTEEKTCTITE